MLIALECNTFNRTLSPEINGMKISVGKGLPAEQKKSNAFSFGRIPQGDNFMTFVLLLQRFRSVCEPAWGGILLRKEN